MVWTRAVLFAVAVCVASSACAERPLPVQPLPELERAKRSAPVPLGSDEPGLVAGERFAWAVDAGGASLGQAQLVVRDREVESAFRTRGLADTVHRIRHSLVTPLGPPRGALDIHSALGLLRSWVGDSAPAGFVRARFDGDAYRLDIAAPVPVTFRHRIYAGRGWSVAVRVTRIGRGEPPLEMKVWLSADARRLPLRVEVVDDGVHVVADLIDYGAPR